MPVTIPRRKIADFCRRWNVSELSFFGSVLHDDFGPDSDVDIVVDFKQGSFHSLLDLARMEAELETLFGRHVDLVSRKALEQSRNYIRKKEILSSLEQVYVA